MDGSTGSDIRPRAIVLGLGNVLMSDDALGPYVAALLQARFVFPAEVEILDVGTPGLDLHPYLDERETVIFVDTVREEGAPGSLHVYDKEEILRHAPQPRINPHDPGVKEALLSLRFAGREPRDVILVGVVPHTVAAGAGLSAPVREALSAAQDAVVAALARLGHEVVLRTEPAAANIWWETAEREQDGTDAD